MGEPIFLPSLTAGLTQKRGYQQAIPMPGRSLWGQRGFEIAQPLASTDVQSGLVTDSEASTCAI